MCGQWQKMVESFVKKRFNSQPNERSGQVQIEGSADNKVVQVLRFVSERLENVGKGENAFYQYSFHFQLHISF